MLMDFLRGVPGFLGVPECFVIPCSGVPCTGVLCSGVPVFRCSMFWSFWKCYMPSFHTQVYKWIPVKFNTGVHLIQEGRREGCRI